jgi:ADP-ribose pyrophosphatase YjhB (NUDIX family)
VKWRPADRVRAVSIGLAVQDERLLVVEVLNDAGKLEGWRPPGGGVQFGEPASTALEREIREELRCNISIDGPPWIFENIYEHEGEIGHEIVFAFPIRLLEGSLHESLRFRISEDSGTLHWAEWIALSRFRSGEHVLYPQGLVEQIGRLTI